MTFTLQPGYLIHTPLGSEIMPEKELFKDKSISLCVANSNVPFRVWYPRVAEVTVKKNYLFFYSKISKPGIHFPSAFPLLWFFVFKSSINTQFKMTLLVVVTLSFRLTMMGFLSCFNSPTEPLMGFFEILLLVALSWSQMGLSIKKAIRRLCISKLNCKKIKSESHVQLQGARNYAW